MTTVWPISRELSDRYDQFTKLALSEAEKRDLMEYLKLLSA